MKLWCNFKDLIHLHIPDHPGEESPLSQNYKDLLISGTTSSEQVALHNIRFDNSMRIAIAATSIAACTLLWMGNFISSMRDVIVLLMTYSLTQAPLALLLRHRKKIRLINMALCSVDLGAISVVIFMTGGSQSPLYFLYFMPLIIQAFHRDWPVLLLYGFGGIILYAVIVVAGHGTLRSPEYVALATRLFMMTLSVNIAFLAVYLLKRKETLEQKKLSRVKFLTYVSQELNQIDTKSDLDKFLNDFVTLLNVEMAGTLKYWNRVFVLDAQTPYLQAIEDQHHSKTELKKILAAHTCPAFQNSRFFALENAENGGGCPTETFDFKSHLCVPITGNENDSYGVLFSGCMTPGAYQPEEISFFQFLAKSIGLAIQRLRRMEELRQSYEMDSFAMACFMESFRNPMATYDTILEGFGHLLKVDQFNLMIWNTDRAFLESIRTIGIKTGTTECRNFSMGEGIPGRTLEGGNAYWAYDLDDANGNEYLAGRYKEIICFPLLTVRGEPLGVLVGSSVEHSVLFTVEEINRASTFATRAAVAIENARLHHCDRSISVLTSEQTENAA